MQWNDVATNWTAHVPRILTRWPDLPENDVLAIDGHQDSFIDLLTRHRGDAVTAQTELADWLMGEEPADAVMDSTRDNARINAAAQDIPPGEDALSDDRKFGDDNQSDRPMGKAE